MIRAFLVDDEELALRRLSRMLEETGRVHVEGTVSDPAAALRQIAAVKPDLLFLDIQMPGLDGFELLRSLDGDQPLVIFTTAHHQYALQAFEVNSIDYLLKPVEADKLARALAKFDRIRGGQENRPELDDVLKRISSALGKREPEYPTRLASRTGDRVEFVDLAKVSHIYAKDKLTFAATAGRDYCLDGSIVELEAKLDPRRFVRVHRSAMINLDYVQELYTWFGGKVLLRLRDEKKTELTVARDRVRALKEKLSL